VGHRESKRELRRRRRRRRRRQAIRLCQGKAVLA
jgi:hypothetical protein